MDSQSKKKVCYISFTNSGGMMHYVDSLFFADNDNAVKQLVVVGSESEMHSAHAKYSTLFIQRSNNQLVQKLFEKYNPLFYRKVANEIIDVLSPDIVHITSYSIGLLSFIKSLINRGVKVVYTVHDPDPHEEIQTLWGKIFHKYQYFINYQEL